MGFQDTRLCRYQQQLGDRPGMPLFKAPPGTWCPQFGLWDYPPFVYCGQMATGLGPHPGQQAVRCETSCTLWRPSCRSFPWDEVVITHLQVGHNHLSHSHFLSMKPPLICAYCNMQLIVTHLVSLSKVYCQTGEVLPTMHHQWCAGWWPWYLNRVSAIFVVIYLS
jgi:hypothetical protein